MEITSAEASRGAAWLLEGFEYFRRYALVWIGFILILIVLYVVLSPIPIIGLVIHFLWPVFMGGMIMGCADMNQGRDLKLNHLFAGFREHSANLVLLGVMYVLGSIIIGIISSVLVVIMIGGFTFIEVLMSGDIPLIWEYARPLLLVILIALMMYVPVIMAMWFAPLLVVLENTGPLDAIRYSFNACLKNILPFLLYGLVGLALSLIVLIPAVIGWFIFMPIANGLFNFQFALLAVIPMLAGLFILGPMIIASVYIAYRDIFISVKPETVVQG